MAGEAGVSVAESARRFGAEFWAALSVTQATSHDAAKALEKEGDATEASSPLTSVSQRVERTFRCALWAKFGKILISAFLPREAFLMSWELIALYFTLITGQTLLSRIIATWEPFNEKGMRFPSIVKTTL